MREKISTVVDLFNSPTFKEYGSLLFEKDRTESEILKTTGISRSTINQIRKRFRAYFIKSKNAKNTSSKSYQLDIRLLSDYFSNILNLNEEENALLLRIISDKNIKNVIIKDNFNTETMISKVILTILLIRLTEGKNSNDKIPISHIINIIFREFMRSRYWEMLKFDKKVSKEERQAYYNGEKTDFTRFVRNGKEADNYEITVIKYSNLYGYDVSIFSSLFKKIFISDISITTYPSVWYGIMIFILKYKEILAKKEFEAFVDREYERLFEKG